VNNVEGGGEIALSSLISLKLISEATVQQESVIPAQACSFEKRSRNPLTINNL
jgi:hypothetical protein